MSVMQNRMVPVDIPQAKKPRLELSSVQQNLLARTGIILPAMQTQQGAVK